MTTTHLHWLKTLAHWIVVMVSITFTVLLFYQISSTSIGKIATVSFGFALELFKIYILVTIKDPHKMAFKYLKKFGLFMVYLSLALASGLATLGFAIGEIEGQSFASSSANAPIIYAEQDLQRYTRQIEDITAKMSQLPPDYITARQRYLTTISELEVLRAEAMATLVNAPTLEVVATDTFTLLGKLPFINLDGETLLFYIFLALVILLEVAIAVTTDFTEDKPKKKKDEEPDPDDDGTNGIESTVTDIDDSSFEISRDEEEEMPGFFNLEKNKSLPTVAIDKKIAGCETCQMYKTCQSPKIAPKGNGRILVVFPSPTRHEDHSKPFNEPYQRYLYHVLGTFGIEAKDITVTHALQCYQGEKVSAKAIEGCHYRLKKTINELEPTMVIITDSVAMKALYHTSNSGRFSFAKYAKFTGSIIHDQDLKTIVVPIESPYEAYDALAFRRKKILERDESAKFNSDLWKDRKLANVDKFRIVDRLIKKQIKRGLGSSFKLLPTHEVEYTIDPVTAVSYLRYFMDKEAYAFDIETDGLKPYVEGHKIYTWGFSDGNRTVAFPHFQDKQFLRVLRHVLTNDAKKIGWNIKFETNWIRHILGYEVTNWEWDGMIAAHILDNRAGITSLKFQAFSELGVVGYDSGLDQFLESEEKNANAFNRIHLAPMDSLLEYNGLDAYYTYRIYERQFPKIKNDQILAEGYELFHNGQIALADMEFNGIGIDIIQVEKNLREVEAKMLEADKKIKSAKELSQWDSIEPFNPNSGKHKIHMFYDIMQYPILKRTDHGEPSTDSDTLEEFAELYENELAGAIVGANTYKKVYDNLKGIKVEATPTGKDGEYEVHPFFNLNTVSSYRSSSDSPNAQNIPVHNPEAARLVLGCYKPRDGKVIVGADYTSIESFVGACYHHDPTFEMYLMKEGTDAHADTACELFLTKKDEVEDGFFKTMRRVGKNVNFSTMYGISVFKLVTNTWNSMLSLEQKEFLKTKGIENIDDWSTHITQWYNDYWNVKYGTLGEWRNNLWQNYIETGEVVGYTGFKAVGKLAKNFVGNMPVQSAAFHFLLRGIIGARKELTNRGISAKLILEIHDSIKIECDEQDIDEVKDVIEQCFIDNNKKRYTWMTMPLQIKGELYRKNLSEEEDHFALNGKVA